MSHGAATPPGLATKALHGGKACRNALCPMPRQPDPVTTTAHPFFSRMVKQILILAAAGVIFIGGLCIGDVTTSTLGGPGNWFGSDMPVQAAVLDKLKHELNLTPSQVARVAPIISTACADLRLIGEERHARRLQALDEISTSIAPMLSADQEDRLQELQAELQHRPPPHAKRDERIVASF